MTPDADDPWPDLPEADHGLACTVVQAAPADAPAVLALHRSVLAEGEWFITEPDEFGETRDSVAARIRDTSGCFLVARVGRAFAGWLFVGTGVRRRSRHVGRLEMMVDARYRGRGVGHALLASAVAWADARPDIGKLSLCVFAHNVRAIALYRAHGFFEEGRREGEYRFADGSLRGDVLMARMCPPG